MPRYRFDFLRAVGDVLASHEIDYDDDDAAITGGHLINGSPTIGCCFQVWRDDVLVHWHYNIPKSSPDVDLARASASKPEKPPA